MFSVLISVYDKENPDFFFQAIESLVNQTLLPNEIVLVKDGPLTQELESILNKFMEEYPNLFSIVSLEKNMGLGYALNKGIKVCKNNLIARMDTDDICKLNRFEKQISFLQHHPEIDVLGANMEEFNKIPGDLNSYKINPKSGKKLLKYSKFRCPVNHPTIIFKKESVLQNGGYGEDILLLEDFTLFIKMLKNGCIFYNQQEVLLNFRIGSGIEIIKRRSGKNYVKNELKFLNYAYKIGHISKIERLIYLCTRIPLRYMPPKFVLWIYHTFLRVKKDNN